MRLYKAAIALFLAMCVPPMWGQLTGGMLSPSIDKPGEPFSYFSHPTDVLGSMYAPVAAEVTPEGYIYTGSGELMFFTGNPPVPVQQRVRTLYKGHLPIVEYSVRHDDVQYDFQMFGADLGGPLESLPVYFVKVSLKNQAAQQRTVFFTSAYRFRSPTNHLSVVEYRFYQAFSNMPQRLTEGQTTFDPNWKYAIGADGVTRNNRLLYTFPAEPDQVSQALDDFGFRAYRLFSGETGTNEFFSVTPPDPSMPRGVAMYRESLAPGENKSLIFKMPIIPLPLDSPEAELVKNARYEDVFEKTAADWETKVSNPPIGFPEEKPQQFMLANTITNLLAVDKIGDKIGQSINKFQYHGFGGCGSTDFPMLAGDYMKQFDVTNKLMLTCLAMASPDGRMGSGNWYWDTTGEVFWIWGRHYALTHDEAFLRAIYPAVVRGVDWIEFITAKDALGLLPVSTMPDDEQVQDVHITGQNLWILHGLQEAVRLAQAMGKPEDVKRFEAVEKRFRQSFEKQLALQTAQTGGYIPPALDRTTKGNDWYNLALLFPEPLFDPFDPRVTATIRASRSRYAEGLLTYVDPHAIAEKNGEYTYGYPPALHYWQSDLNAESALVRGGAEDQELAVKDMYALLLHTNATHSTQEWGTPVWGTRDIPLAYPDNIQPDQVTSGRMMILMRNMLVREYGNDLYLLSAISPEWLRPGKRIELAEEPTEFGPLSATVDAKDNGWELNIASSFPRPPQRLVVRVPWFYEVERAEADGKTVTAKNGEWSLPVQTKKLQVTGRIKPGTPSLSFDSTVEEYKQEYARRYEMFLRTGSSKE